VSELNNFEHRGARALILLHEEHFRECLRLWKEAKAAGIEFPETTDADYQSLETLLVHILGSARGYMLWICEQLELPDPEIRTLPEVVDIEAEADDYLEHLLERWRLPLANIEEEKFYHPEYLANEGMQHLCIDVMVEHALVHPIRHAFQLKELIKQQSS